MDYANGEVYEEDATEVANSAEASDCDNAALDEEEVVMWNNNDIHLLLQILDHQAMLEEDHAKAYAFLSVAHIMRVCSSTKSRCNISTRAVSFSDKSNTMG